MSLPGNSLMRVLWLRTGQVIDTFIVCAHCQKELLPAGESGREVCSERQRVLRSQGVHDGPAIRRTARKQDCCWRSASLDLCCAGGLLGGTSFPRNDEHYLLRRNGAGRHYRRGNQRQVGTRSSLGRRQSRSVSRSPPWYVRRLPFPCSARLHEWYV